MITNSAVLDVPYYVQPTDITCQSTCLKMMASYLENRIVFASMGAANKDVLEIWKEINLGNERPVQARNSYRNMKWWLSKYFPMIQFEIKETKNPDQAINTIVGYLSGGFPVMVSTNHSRTKGHIILVIGYSGYQPMASSANIRFVCHDPYGRFNPQLNSTQYGKRGRFEGGSSLAGALGEVGPGKAIQYDVFGIRRVRADSNAADTFFTISGSFRR